MLSKFQKLTLLVLIFFFYPTPTFAAITQNNTLGTYSVNFSASSDIGSSSVAKVNTTSGVVQLTNSSNGFTGPFRTSGYVFTQVIKPVLIAKWNTISFAANTPANTSIKLQFYDEYGTIFPDTDLPGNSIGFTATPTDISSLDILKIATKSTYWTGKIPRLKIKITLTTSDTSVTPSIDSLSLSWTPTQGDLSASALDTNSWALSSNNPRGTKHSNYSNDLTYPAFRWVGETQPAQYLENIAGLHLNNQYVFSSEYGEDRNMYFINRNTGLTEKKLPFYSPLFSPLIAQNHTLYNDEDNNDVLIAYDLDNWSSFDKHPNIHIVSPG